MTQRFVAGNRAARLAAILATVVTRVAALATLASVVPAVMGLWSHPGNASVRSIGIVNTPDGPTAHVMIYSGWPGFALALVALVGLPVAVWLASGRRRRPAVRAVAYALLGAWMARWVYGFGTVLWTFDGRPGWIYWVGVIVSSLAVLGALVGVAGAAGRRPAEA